MGETTILKKIQITASKVGARLFRNNVSLAWASNNIRRFTKRQTITIQVNPGDIILFNARPIHAGLCEGSSDLIGWKTINGVAVFTACEVKTPRGRTSQKQQWFLDAVNKSGGLAFVARSEDDVIQYLQQER